MKLWDKIKRIFKHDEEPEIEVEIVELEENAEAPEAPEAQQSAAPEEESRGIEIKKPETLSFEPAADLPDLAEKSRLTDEYVEFIQKQREEQSGEEVKKTKTAADAAEKPEEEAPAEESAEPEKEEETEEIKE